LDPVALWSYRILPIFEPSLYLKCSNIGRGVKGGERKREIERERERQRERGKEREERERERE